MIDPAAYEKLGQFYLGKSYDLAAREIRDELILYDSKDLVTHAVCVGMTGSGKTGLCLGLLEEAAMDGVPALIVDPKGDLANLLLTFPELRPEDFEPWIDPDEASRKGLSTHEYARDRAELWRGGLAEWGQDGERIRKLREAADFTVYTPGSNAGIPISILSSFAAPPPEMRDDPELLGDRISSTATSLLGLLKIDADPLRSREHILLSNILHKAWAEGEDMDLARLIREVQHPPMERVGVMQLESFFPEKERFELAMSLNNLLAAPSFQTWLSGEALDIDRMLYTETGKPRLSIFSIAHLPDAERMFFVSLLLNQVVGWMRGQSGTTSLRALVYIDEIFGYMPPVAEPPSKRPLLTLLKQARAFGVGVVLATQNPVDLDYKGLSNTGTWFLGRLQTERDKARVLDGLEGATAGGGTGFERGELSELLSGLGKRVFLMHNVHEDGPELFHTRFVMSYLRGPLTRDQIKALTKARKKDSGSPAPVAARGKASPASIAAAGPPAATPGQEADHLGRPLLPPDVPEVFVRPPSAIRGSDIAYVPALLGITRVNFIDARRGIDFGEEVALLTSFPDGTSSLDWREADDFDIDEDRLEPEPLDGARFRELPESATQGKHYRDWKRALTDDLYRTRRLTLFKSPTLKETSQPGESERDFRIRLASTFRERRDLEVEKLRKKYASRIVTGEERVRRAGERVEREAEQAREQKMQTAISMGATVLSAFLGRKRVSARSIGRATTAVRGMSRGGKEAQDVARAQDSLEAQQQRLADLEAEFENEVNGLEDRYDPEAEDFRTVDVPPRKRDVDVRLVALAWVPVHA